MRPANCIMIIRRRRAEFVDVRLQKVRRLDPGDAVQQHHLVKRALQRALGAGPIVTDDVVDQRVAEGAPRSCSASITRPT